VTSGVFRTLTVGTQVGEYKITGLIGKGGMGIVYEGIQPIIDKRVAIKVLSHARADEEAMVERFMQEARAVTRIDHPNIIDVYFFGQLQDGRCYFVMEHLNGESLSHLLARRAPTYSEARRFLGQTCDALAAAHAEGIIHRDLKPDNLFVVRPRRGHAYIKVLDFGIAKLYGAEPRVATRAGHPMGTPEYMSPEQSRGDAAIDGRTDVYALGILLYRIVTGKVPFVGASYLQILHQQMSTPPVPPAERCAVPPRLNDLILRCLAKDPNERPSTMVDLLEELEATFEAEGPAIAEILADESAALKERPPHGASLAHGLVSPLPGTPISRPDVAPSPSPKPGPTGPLPSEAIAGSAAPPSITGEGPRTTTTIHASRLRGALVVLGVALVAVAGTALFFSLRKSGAPTGAGTVTVDAASAPRTAPPDVQAPPAATKPDTGADTSPATATMPDGPAPAKAARRRRQSRRRRRKPSFELKTSR
jgi:serine/threonine-protein kinase